MALYNLIDADVPLRNYSLTHSLAGRLGFGTRSWVHIGLADWTE